jgi:pimeloyl-ACP methyl ester carboxylesterase
MLNKNPYLLGLVASAAIIAVSGLARGQSNADPPEKVTLKTDDGVQLSATYYPSSLGNKAVPVVMLADHKVAQSVYAPLAVRLQSPSEGDAAANIPPDTHQSFAVLTVDLRGHGDSLRQTLPNGNTRTLDATKLNRQDLMGMVALDMKAARKFLVDKNDAGKLNINALSIVGAELGATVAVNWAATDWAWPALATGKQGQDVKALVLISPAWKFRGLSMQQALRQPGLQKEIAVLMLYGKQGKSESADVKRIFEMLAKHHPDSETKEAGKLTDLEEIGADINVQGTQLLKNRSAENVIIAFLQEFVVAKEFPWSKRRPD